MKTYIAKKNIAEGLGRLIISLSVVGVFVAPPALAESMAGGPFMGASGSNSGGPQGSSSFTSAHSHGHTMGSTQLSTQSNGVTRAHSLTGAPYSTMGDGNGYAHYWRGEGYQGNNNGGGGGQRQTNSSSYVQPGSGYQQAEAPAKPAVHNYIGQNTSHQGEVSTYTWGINRLKSKQTISR